MAAHEHGLLYSWRPITLKKCKSGDNTKLKRLIIPQFENKDELYIRKSDYALWEFFIKK